MTIRFIDTTDNKEKTFNADYIEFNHYIEVCIAKNDKTGKKLMVDTKQVISITKEEQENDNHS